MLVGAQSEVLRGERLPERRKREAMPRGSKCLSAAGGAIENAGEHLAPARENATQFGPDAQHGSIDTEELCPQMADR